MRKRKQTRKRKRKLERKGARTSFGFIEKPGRLLKFKVRKRKSTQKPSTKKQLVCPLCNLVFHSKKRANLERHMQLHQKFVKRWKCTSCGRTYSSEFNFKRHLPRRHTNEDHTKITWFYSSDGTHVRPIYPKYFWFNYWIKMKTDQIWAFFISQLFFLLKFRFFFFISGIQLAKERH